ncbi:16S rRNA (guanine(527)-N(7))-methyltransferase RsmG [Salinarimonas soli]|uniref:Ribosomal RNA small subunit methyltransferase G n=1 Tax=Salinarimonas soli TaxID=1638099 RepID=A0A5B2VE75_9HYPH|nr:16S rRNA (guanine(527)-N(7))-methyltransferase RsmG [Salinarimonas soli]KAA2237843.1 16S rRNA (guanine(527)-N(7))-methyltransferase RsmG [Salinarimonas soli]
MSDDPDHALRGFDVSRETRERLEILVAELRRWQQIKNLVGPETLKEVWHRHIADSLQLAALAPDARTWIDLGSGAGFPGLVLGIQAAERAGHMVHLVESNGRKCAFLRHAARATGAAVRVHDARLEDVVPSLVAGVDVVTARALAPLPQLLAWTEPLLKNGALGLFPKGEGAAAELTEAAKSLRFNAETVVSRTDPRASILRITWPRDPA